MAKNRKSAKESKAKRVLDFEALKNDVNLNMIQYQNEVETLAEIAKINSAVADGIRKFENEIRVLKIEKASRE